jgi:alpha-amylase
MDIGNRICKSCHFAAAWSFFPFTSDSGSYSLNPSFGTADDLVALSAALHARSMYLMVDVVANHMVKIPLVFSESEQISVDCCYYQAYYGEGNTTKYSVYSPFDNEKYFHPYCLISNYDNQTNVEDCWLGDTTVTLPDLNTTRLDVQNIWYSWVHSLVSNYSGKEVNSTLYDM